VLHSFEGSVPGEGEKGRPGLLGAVRVDTELAVVDTHALVPAEGACVRGGPL